MLLSVDYFTLWLNVSLFDSIAEISRLHFVGGSLITVLGKIILFLVVLLIRKKVGGESSDVLRSTDWLRFIFFPVFTIFTVIALIMTSGNIENQKQENVFLVIALCLAGMNIVVFYMINDILKREIKIRENEVFQLKARNQTDMYRSISENFVKQRKKTHEYKNQIMCIESLIEIGLIGTANHPNMHMTSDELMESKKSARTIVLLEGCIILGCVLLDADMVYVSYMAIAVILCAALLCIAKIFKQEVKE